MKRRNFVTAIMAALGGSAAGIDSRLQASEDVPVSTPTPSPAPPCKCQGWGPCPACGAPSAVAHFTDRGVLKIGYGDDGEEVYRTWLSHR